MAINMTDEQKNQFKEYIKTNKVDPTKVGVSDLKEYMDTGSINIEGKIKQPTQDVQMDQQKDMADQQKQLLDQQRVDLAKQRAEEAAKPVEIQQPQTPAPKEGQVQDIKETSTETVTPSEEEFRQEDVVSKAPVFQGADGKFYQTVRNKDNTLTTIDATTGQPVTGKYSDTERESVKQSFLEEKEQAKRPDVNTIYADLVSGKVISPEIMKTPDYKAARQRKANLDMYSSMSTSDLSLAMDEGQLLPGTQTYNDLKAENPSLIRDAETLNSLNAINGDKKSADDMETSILKKVYAMISDDSEVATFDERVSNSSEYQTAKRNMEDSSTRLAELQDQLDFVQEDIEKDLGGRSVTKGYMNFRIGEKSEQLTRQYNLELNKFRLYAGQMDSITSGIQFDIEQEKQDKADEFSRLETALGLYRDATADERSLELQKQQLLLQSGDLESSDPFIQDRGIQNAVNALYQLYPIPGMESPAVKVQKVKSLMAQGLTATQAIQQLENEIRGTQRYADYIAGEQPSTTQDYELKEVGDKTYRFNKRTGEYEDIETGSKSSQYTQNIQSIIDYSQKKRGRDNLQCGELVNDYWTQVTGSRAGMGDTMESKIDALLAVGISDSPVAGGLFISNPLGNDVGHTGIVQNVNPDGSITVLEANYKGTTEGSAPVTKTYTAEEVENMRFSVAPEGEVPTEAKYSEDAIAFGKNIQAGVAKLSDVTGNPELKAEVSRYIANEKRVYEDNDPIVLGITDDIKLIGGIVDWEEGGFFDTTNESLAEDVSGGFQFSPWDSITGEKQQFLRKIQKVLDSEALQNLIDIKAQGATFGSLTEKEMAMLQKSASFLNSAANRDEKGNITGFTMDEEEFKKELQNMLERMESTKKGLMGQLGDDTVTGGRVKGSTGGRIK